MIDRFVERRLVAAWIFAGSICCSTAALAGAFAEPPVLASSHGLLDLLVIAQPQPVPSISFTSPGGSTLHPTGWVYQVCPRQAAIDNNQCPSNSVTVSSYGGIRLALQKGDTLKIRLVNRLPALDPIKVTHSVDPGGANLPLNLTNLHTHGLVVQARAPTLADPTFGDDIFVAIYNSANGTPAPQTTHQHGSIVKDYVDYRIDIREIIRPARSGFIRTSTGLPSTSCRAGCPASFRSARSAIMPVAICSKPRFPRTKCAI